MKKIAAAFLTFITVTSITNATIWTIRDEAMSPIYAITVSVADNPQAILLALAVDSNGVLSNFAAGADAPKDSYLWGTLEDFGVGYLGQGEVWGMEDFDWPGVYNDGDWLTAEFEFASEGTSATISLYDVTTGSPAFLTSHIMEVPEPITLSLLALGGLFLRRHR